jgi:hypothetical protein
MQPDTSQEELRTAKTWERRHAAKLGRAVQQQRGGRSAVWLEQRTAELGLKVTRQTVADLESGRRRFVTTAELLVLAAALDTTPVHLMFPDFGDEPENVVEVLPGVETTGFQATQWFSGHRCGFVDPDDELDEGDARAAEKARSKLRAALLESWRLLDELNQRRHRIVAPEGGTLSQEQIQLLDAYNLEIHTLRKQLETWKDFA